jgi:hypothetical protein
MQEVACSSCADSQAPGGSHTALSAPMHSLHLVLVEIYRGSENVHDCRRLDQDPDALVLHQLVELALLVCESDRCGELREPS